MNKDILDKALEKALTESYDELIESDIPDYDFSDSFEEKMSCSCMAFMSRFYTQIAKLTICGVP